MGRDLLIHLSTKSVTSLIKQMIRHQGDPISHAWLREIIIRSGQCAPLEAQGHCLWSQCWQGQGSSIKCKHCAVHLGPKTKPLLVMANLTKCLNYVTVDLIYAVEWNIFSQIPSMLLLSFI